MGEVLPGVEDCGNEGADDDCNGTDDDIRERGEPCTIDDAMGVCRDGWLDCAGETFGCQGPSAGDETCNDLDDDCDGKTDEGLLEDVRNCGRCGVRCDTGQDCCGGSCVEVAKGSRTGKSLASNAWAGALAACVLEKSSKYIEYSCGFSPGALAIALRRRAGTRSTSPFVTPKDPLHCGRCGNDCGAGLDCCSGNCVDLQSDPFNCNGCGRDCPLGGCCEKGECSAVVICF